jgi:putative restriction endonuclease
LLNDRGRLSGRAQSAVRALSAADFGRIIASGLQESDGILPRVGEELPPGGLGESQTPFAVETPRERVQVLSSRILRDRVFRRIVLRAYGERCAVTGLRLINGGGRAEVAAAHIRPVEANGPDIVSNGLALSGTAHWMFDRGLISLNDDLRILISRQANNVEEIRGFLNPGGYARPPARLHERPHPHFLKWHRDNCFKL